MSGEVSLSMLPRQPPPDPVAARLRHRLLAVINELRMVKRENTRLRMELQATKQRMRKRV